MQIPLIRRKVIGKHVIFERKPKPRGLSKYVVGLDGDEQNMVKDFSRYALAVLWCKAQEPKPVPKVVILLDGGLVRYVFSTVAMDYTVLQVPQHPDGNDPSDFITAVETGEADTKEGHATVDPDRIASILNAVQPIKLT